MPQRGGDHIGGDLGVVLGAFVRGKQPPWRCRGPASLSPGRDQQRGHRRPQGGVRREGQRTERSVEGVFDQ